MTHEASLRALEEELALASFEQSLEYERLEVLERQLTAVELSLAQREEEAEASLASREARI